MSDAQKKTADAVFRSRINAAKAQAQVMRRPRTTRQHHSSDTGRRSRNREVTMENSTTFTRDWRVKIGTLAMALAIVSAAVAVRPARADEHEHHDRIGGRTSSGSIVTPQASPRGHLCAGAGRLLCAPAGCLRPAAPAGRLHLHLPVQDSLGPAAGVRSAGPLWGQPFSSLVRNWPAVMIGRKTSSQGSADPRR